jgi:hypothetical protein
MKGWPKEVCDLIDVYSSTLFIPWWKISTPETRPTVVVISIFDLYC